MCCAIEPTKTFLFVLFCLFLLCLFCCCCYFVDLCINCFGVLCFVCFFFAFFYLLFSFSFLFLCLITLIWINRIDEVKLAKPVNFLLKWLNSSKVRYKNKKYHIVRRVRKSNRKISFKMPCKSKTANRSMILFRPDFKLIHCYTSW
jgi:hypothetical protein